MEHKKYLVKHVIPQLGLQTVEFYQPADFIHRRLSEHDEVDRLSRLLHLGALSRAFPGTRQARWDYTMAMAHYAQTFKVAGLNRRLSFRNTNFSSVNAALQTMALIWNVGHLPGTFAVEKGLLRHLHCEYPDNPIKGLPWPEIPEDLGETLYKRSQEILNELDYRGVARVLTLIKLLKFCEDYKEDFLFQIVVDFAAPLLLNNPVEPITQWRKLQRTFRIIRHLAYLTLDAPFTGLQWSPGIPQFVKQTIANDQADLLDVDRRISEVLSPFERAIYERIYHSTSSLQETAVVAELAETRLNVHPEPVNEIERWLSCSSLDELQLDEAERPNPLHQIADVRIRSHFVPTPKLPVSLELELKNKGFKHPTVLKYKAWHSDILIEPDEITVGIVSDEVPNIRDIGITILWLIHTFDKPMSSPDDAIANLGRLDLEASYLSLLNRAIQLKKPGWNLQITPWSLRRFGLLKDVDFPESYGGVWASNARLDDALIRHLLRDRKRYISADLYDQYAELSGLRELRLHLRKQWADRKELRQRWLMLTSSVQFWEESKTLLEFDGGLVKLSTRSGDMTLYLMESKSGDGSPLYAIKNKIEEHNLPGNAQQLDARYAFLEWEM